MSSPPDSLTGGFDAPLYEAASSGKVMLQRCRACGFMPNFPRVACPGCLGELEWFESGGRGRVETFTIIRRTHHSGYEPHVPIVMALIRLDEGVETISTIVGETRLNVDIGSHVRAAVGWSTLPQFELEPQTDESA